MSTLYVTDLDGTLLNSHAQFTPFSRDTINSLIDKGMLFSFATARSAKTATKVTSGLSGDVPIIVYTGTFIMESESHRILHANYMTDDEIAVVTKAVKSFKLYPIVYTHINGEEKFIYDPDTFSENVNSFAKTREGDARRQEVHGGFESALMGDIFYFTFMEPKEQLEPVYEFLKSKCNCLFQPDNYTDNWFLEVMPKGATKAQAALRLKEITGADKLVVFGDGYNDLKLFEVADEAYAVSNAEEAVKAAATAVIDSCDNDAVAKWLCENFR